MFNESNIFNMTFVDEDLLNTTNSNETFETIDYDDVFNEIGVPTLTKTLSLLGIIICLIGIIGNIFSIIVLCRKSMKKLSTYSYLLGLSICDEISLTLTIFIFLDYLIPSFIGQMRPKSGLSIVNFFKILLIYVNPIAISTQALSIWITLAFTVDRYLYVCQPFYGREYCTRRRASIVIICLYVLASIYSIPLFLEKTYVRVNILGVERVWHTNTDLGGNKYFIYVFHVFIYTALVSLIPFFIILILNCFLVHDIIKSNKRHRALSMAGKFSFHYNSSTINTHHEDSNNSKLKKKRFLTSPSKFLLNTCFKKKLSKSDKADEFNNNNNHNDATDPCLTANNTGNNSITSNQLSMTNQFPTDRTIRNDVTIMLIGLIIVFLICQAPSTILRLITFKNLSMMFKPLYASTLDISNFLVVCNSTLNCILYVMLGKKFRQEFLQLFCSKIYKKKFILTNFNGMN